MRCNYKTLDGHRCKRITINKYKKCWQHITKKQTGGDPTKYQCKLSESNNGGICTDKLTKDNLRCYMRNMENTKLKKIYKCNKLNDLNQFNDCDTEVIDIDRSLVKYVCDPMPVVDSELKWPDERINVMANKQHVFLNRILNKTFGLDDPLISNYLNGHYYFGSQSPNTVIQSWKGSGYAKIQSVNIIRYKGAKSLQGVDDEKSVIVSQDDLNAGYIFLQIILDLPRFDMPVVVYRGLKQELDYYIMTKFKLFPGQKEFKSKLIQYKSQFIIDRYPLGEIVPIYEFISTGLVINQEDNYLIGEGGDSDKVLLEHKNPNHIMFKINIPKNYPFFSFYQKPGDSSNKKGYGASYVTYDKDGLELSEVILPYTNDRTGNSLTHGYLVKNIIYDAKIKGIQIYALIEVDIVSLKTSIPLTDVSKFGLYNPSKYDKVGNEIFINSNDQFINWWKINLPGRPVSVIQTPTTPVKPTTPTSITLANLPNNERIKLIKIELAKIWDLIGSDMEKINSFANQDDYYDLVKKDMLQSNYNMETTKIKILKSFIDTNNFYYEFDKKPYRVKLDPVTGKIIKYTI